MRTTKADLEQKIQGLKENLEQYSRTVSEAHTILDGIGGVGPGTIGTRVASLCVEVDKLRADLRGRARRTATAGAFKTRALTNTMGEDVHRQYLQVTAIWHTIRAAQFEGDWEQDLWEARACLDGLEQMGS